MGRSTFGVFLSSLLSASCNSVFYQPDPTEFVTPTRVEVSYDEFAVPSSDDVFVAVWHMKHDVALKLDRPKGVLVQFHGNGENMSTHFLSAVWLTAAGYDVVSFDYRGYGKSSPVGPDREGCIEDSKAVLKWIESHPTLSQTPLFVLGQSLGGAVAIPTLVEMKPKKLQGLILDSTFSSYRRIARQKLGSVWLTWPLQWPLSFLVTDGRSPVDVIDQIKVPILSVHSPKDPVVPYQLGRELFDAATVKDKTFWDIRFPGHAAAFALEESEYRDQLVAWLAARQK